MVGENLVVVNKSKESSKRIEAVDDTRRGKRALRHIVAVFGIFVVLGLFTLFWIRLRDQFPLIAPGEYLGELKFHGSANDNLLSKYFYLRRDTKPDKITVAVFRTGWTPITLAVEESGAGDSWLYPLILKGPNTQLRLRGAPVGSSKRYAGVYEDLQGSDRGTWKLSPIQNLEGDPKEIEELRTWLNYKVELRDIEDQIFAAEGLNLSDSMREQQLNQFVTEGQDLKSQTVAREEAIRVQILEMRKQLKAKRLEALQLEQQLALSNEVTPMGRLVRLARDSLERDYRWIESVSRSSGGIRGDDLKAELKRAQDVLRLKEEILAEKEKVFELLANSSRGGSDAQP